MPIRSLPLKGFMRTPLAPALAASSGALWSPVIRTTGVDDVRGSPLRRRQASTPSSFGSRASIRMIDGIQLSTSAKRLSSSADSTWNPLRSSTSRVTLTIDALSSTMSTLVNAASLAI